MKPVVSLVACLCLTVLAPTPVTPIQSRLDSEPAVLQRRGAGVLSRERARSKANLCGKAGPSDESYGQCYLAEGKITDADYTGYVRVIGALLRLPPYARTALPGPPRRPAFDTAEATWLTYREQSCRAMTYQWEGGTLGRVNYPKCLLSVTWDHITNWQSSIRDIGSNGRGPQPGHPAPRRLPSCDVWAWGNS
jgi:uncharacterized protein YecT (DUF1311 family)